MADHHSLNMVELCKIYGKEDLLHQISLNSRNKESLDKALKIMRLNLSFSNIDPFQVFKLSAQQVEKEPKLRYYQQENLSNSVNFDTIYDKKRKFISLMNPFMCFLVFSTHFHSVYFDDSTAKPTEDCVINNLDRYHWLIRKLKIIGCTNALDVMVTVFYFTINIINLILMIPMRRLKKTINLSEILLLLDSEIELKRIDGVIEAQLELMQVCINTCRVEAIKASVYCKNDCRYKNDTRNKQKLESIMKLLCNNQQIVQKFRQKPIHLRPKHFNQNCTEFQQSAVKIIYFVTSVFVVFVIFSFMMVFLGVYLRYTKTLSFPTTKQNINLILLLIYVVILVQENSGYLTCFGILISSHRFLMNESLQIVRETLRKLRHINELSKESELTRERMIKFCTKKQLDDFAWKERCSFMEEANGILMDTIVRLLVHLTEIRRCSSAASVMIANPIITILYVLIPTFICTQLETPTARQLLTWNVMINWILINFYGYVFATMARQMRTFERMCLSICAENVKRLSDSDQSICYDMITSIWIRFISILRDGRMELIPRILYLNISNDLIIQFNFFTILSVVFVLSRDIFLIMKPDR